ncbi:hypothetical protein ACLQ24_16770 [Micromonospora sp. DT4]|uniref:hypothetical protein n=1 Tax=Micromonospora sp. DT4 TaxID=3393438 RepID=UPI003CF57021
MNDLLCLIHGRLDGELVGVAVPVQALCPEFDLTWVPSGHWVGSAPVPDAVLAAARVDNRHLVHADPVVLRGAGFVAGLLRGQPLDVVVRMVCVPFGGLPGGVVEALALAGQLGLPVLAREADENGRERDSQVVPFDAAGAMVVSPPAGKGVQLQTAPNLATGPRTVAAITPSSLGPAPGMISAVGAPAQPGAPSDRLLAAFAKLLAWTGAADSRGRVAQVLAELGAPTIVRDDLIYPVDLLDKRFGGAFRPAAIADLVALPLNEATVVYLESPHEQPHVVIVERVSESEFVYAKTQVRSRGSDAPLPPPGTFTRFTRDGLRGMEQMPHGVLSGTIRLPYRDGALASLRTDSDDPLSGIPFDRDIVRRYIAERGRLAADESSGPRFDESSPILGDWDLWRRYGDTEPGRLVAGLTGGDPVATEVVRLAEDFLTAQGNLPEVADTLQFRLRFAELSAVRGADGTIGFPFPLVGRYGSPDEFEELTVVLDAKGAVQTTSGDVVVRSGNRFRLLDAEWDDGLYLTYTDSAVGSAVAEPPPPVDMGDILTAMFGAPAGPIGLRSTERQPDGSVRLNPTWRRLDDPGVAEALNNGRGLRWNYSVGPDGVLQLGVEDVRSSYDDSELDELYRRMNDRMPLAREEFDAIFAFAGHPAIGVGFDNEGNLFVRPARISGELAYNQHSGDWVVNDKSGRYMDAHVRPPVARDSNFWLKNVATLIAETLHLKVTYVPSEYGLDAVSDPVRVSNQAAVFASRYSGPATERAALHRFLLDRLRNDEVDIDSALRHADLVADALGLRIEPMPKWGVTPTDRRADRLALATAYYGHEALTEANAHDTVKAIVRLYQAPGRVDTLQRAIELKNERRDLARAVLQVVAEAAPKLPTVPLNGRPVAIFMARSAFNVLNKAAGGLVTPAPMAAVYTTKPFEQLPSPGEGRVALVLHVRRAHQADKCLLIAAGTRLRASTGREHPDGGLTVEHYEVTGLQFAQTVAANPSIGSLPNARLAAWVTNVQTLMPPDALERVICALGALIAAYPELTPAAKATYTNETGPRLDHLPVNLGVRWTSAKRLSGNWVGAERHAETRRWKVLDK